MFLTVAQLRRNVRNPQQLVGHQRDVCGLERGVAPATPIAIPTSADASAGVVDAVADHRHRSVLAPKLFDRGDLVFRKQLRAELIDAELRGDRRRRARLSPVSITMCATPWHGANRWRPCCSGGADRRRR